jgi:hypothetical protein
MGLKQTRSQLKSGGRIHRRSVVSFEQRQRERVKVTREKYIFISAATARFVFNFM